MFHFRLWVFSSLTCFGIFFGAFSSARAAAATEASSAAPAPVKIEAPLAPSLRRSFTVNYTTWIEQMTLDNGSSQVKDVAQLIGVGLTFNQERFRRSSWGSLYEVTLLSGQANGGGTQTTVPYQKSHLSWSGAEVSYRAAYRMTPSILFSVGPIVIYRKITWPSDSPDISVRSGSDTNFGAVAEMKFLLNPHWQLVQSFGTLGTKASTIWSLGTGYRY